MGAHLAPRALRERDMTFHPQAQHRGMVHRMLRRRRRGHRCLPTRVLAEFPLLQVGVVEYHPLRAVGGAMDSAKGLGVQPRPCHMEGRVV